MRILQLLASTAGLLLLAVAVAHADRAPERGRPHRARVTFFEDADFRGAYLTLETGDQAANLTREHLSNGARANDRISSIRIEGAADVEVFRDAGFSGGVLHVTHDVRNLERLGGWNDAISSIRVRPAGDNRRP